ncbi:MAG TPA: hypothetical protein VGD71_00815 [Kribbella sp.]
MTSAERTASVLPSGTERRFRDVCAPYLPALFGFVAACLILLLSGTSLLSTSAYTLYVVGALVLPGTLLYRSLAGYSENLLTDLAWGIVTGFMFELVCWAGFTVVGGNRALWIWPVAVIALYAGHPRLRRFWRRPSGAASTPAAMSWACAWATVVGWAYVAATFYRSSTPAPSGRSAFVDVPWHLGVAYEATRAVPLQTPESSADGILHYHFFVDAHFAAASLISRVDLLTIVTRTGLFPLIFAMVAATMALTYKLSGRPWIAALAGLLVTATTPGVDFWGRTFRLPILFPDSPSGIFSVGISCLVVAILVDFARRERVSPLRLCLFALTLLISIGSKPSILLVCAPAAALVVGLDLVRRRPLNRGLALAVAMMAAAIVVSIPVFASSGGSTLRPGIKQVLVWNGSTYSTPVLILLITAVAKGYLLAFTAALAFMHKTIRKDPGAHLMGALVLVGFSVAWIVSHPGLSERFFWMSGVPFAIVLTAWSTGLTLESSRITRVPLTRFLTFSLAVALVALTLARHFPRRGPSLAPGWALLVVVAVLVVLAARRAGLSVAAGLLVAVVASVVVSAPAGLVAAAYRPAHVRTYTALLNEQKAGVWVAAHTPLDTTFATNAHCILTRTSPHCDARNFWLSGYGGRRVLIGGYGVTPYALRKTGIDGYTAWHQPYHDQQLYGLNEKAFTNPDRTVLRRLYLLHNVRWLAADRSAGPVSGRLAKLADLKYENDTVAIYRLDPALLG